MTSIETSDFIDATRRWIASVVIGLGLCPFAERVFRGGLIRYAVSDAANEDALLQDLASELERLVSESIASLETTLLVHPRVLSDFLSYNDFLDDAEALLVRRGLEGVIQIASFHPRYQFAGTDVDDIENYTNRSPYPMLHLLREVSIEQAADDEESLLAIPRRNIETMRGLSEEMAARLRAGIRTA